MAVLPQTRIVDLALVGAGFIGQKHLKSIAEFADARAVGIVDPDQRAQRLASEYNVPWYPSIEALFDAQAPAGVIVATPTEAHLEPTLKALGGGADVLVEKPLAASVDEAQQMVDQARRLGRQILVGHHRRHYPLMGQTRQLIADGSIGELLAVQGQWTQCKPEPYFAADWRKRRAAGPVLTNLIHELDSLRFICGEIDAISAEVTHRPRGYEKEDVACLLIRFANGACGTFLLSDATPSPWTWEGAVAESDVFFSAGKNTHRFLGSKGAMEFPNLALWREAEPGRGWHGELVESTYPRAAVDPYAKQIEHFCALIAGVEPALCSGQDGLNSLRATLAVFDAATTGRRIKIDTAP